MQFVLTALLTRDRHQMNGKMTPLYLYAFLIVFLVFAVIFRSARAVTRTVNTSDRIQPTTMGPTVVPSVAIAPTTLPATAMAATPVQPTAAPSPMQPAAPALTGKPSAIDQQSLLNKYGDAVYPSLQSMPADLQQYYLYWIFKAQATYGVPAEDILATHFAEQMGAGLRPLETRTSSAGAVGPGQITPGYWNGWSAGSPRTYFLSNVSSIQAFGGCGVDFDGNGVADPQSLPDNVAATACGLARDHVQLGLRGSDQHANVLSEALCIYNSGKSCAFALPATRQYAQYGINWMMANAAEVQALASSYLK